MGRIDRRNSKRITYICEVECETEGAHRITTRVNDISMTGMFIDSMTNFAVGRVLKLKFRVKDRLIETMGEVRYSMRQVGMGVRFINLNAEQRAVLESLIEGKPLVLPEPAEQPQGPIKGEASGSNMFSGNFAVISLFDVIQMIDNSRLTGALRLTLPSTSGEIRFNEGQIVGASAGLLTDSDALNRLLGATEGSFEFQKSDLAFERGIEADSNTALLLELLRLKDEENIVPATPKSAG